jgi:hypothetical protein
VAGGCARNHLCCFASGAAEAVNLDFDHLISVACAIDGDARPWTWHASERPDGGGYPQQVIRVGDVALICECYDEPDHPSVTAEYIATFDPPTVRALLAAALNQRDAA